MQKSLCMTRTRTPKRSFVLNSSITKFTVKFSKFFKIFAKTNETDYQHLFYLWQKLQLSVFYLHSFVSKLTKSLIIIIIEIFFETYDFQGMLPVATLARRVASSTTRVSALALPQNAATQVVRGPRLGAIVPNHINRNPEKGTY